MPLTEDSYLRLYPNDHEAKECLTRLSEVESVATYGELWRMLRDLRWSSDEVGRVRRCAMCKKTAVEAGHEHAKNCELARIFDAADNNFVAAEKRCREWLMEHRPVEWSSW